MFWKLLDRAGDSNMARKRHSWPGRGRKDERGQTIFLVAVALHADGNFFSPGWSGPGLPRVMSRSRPWQLLPERQT